MVLSLRSGRYGALLFQDLDHFKMINDTKVHAIGDLLLAEVAHRLKACLREGDTVARLSGDEFVLVLEELSKELDEAATQAELIAEKISKELNRPYTPGDNFCYTTARTCLLTLIFPYTNEQWARLQPLLPRRKSKNFMNVDTGNRKVRGRLTSLPHSALLSNTSLCTSLVASAYALSQVQPI